MLNAVNTPFNRVYNLGLETILFVKILANAVAYHCFRRNANIASGVLGNKHGYFAFLQLKAHVYIGHVHVREPVPRWAYGISMKTHNPCANLMYKLLINLNHAAKKIFYIVVVRFTWSVVKVSAMQANNCFTVVLLNLFHHVLSVIMRIKKFIVNCAMEPWLPLIAIIEFANVASVANLIFGEENSNFFVFQDIGQITPKVVKVNKQVFTLR
jgi:hypothetical protein